MEYFKRVFQEVAARRPLRRRHDAISANGVQHSARDPKLINYMFIVGLGADGAEGEEQGQKHTRVSSGATRYFCELTSHGRLLRAFAAKPQRRNNEAVARRKDTHLLHDIHFEIL